MPKPAPTPYTTPHPPTLAEQEDVHAVYEAIAPHFSSTRYKPWPLVSSFLQSLPPYSIGLDSGAGNGKYVPLASEQGRMCWALDMSWGLLSVARGSLGGGVNVDAETGMGGQDGQAEQAGTSTSSSSSPSRGPVECLRGELGYDGWRAGVFDWAISIAAIHHLSTPQRRCQAIQALMRSLVHRSSHTDDNQPRSRFMIYVWAYEQGEGSKRKMGKRAAGGRTPDEASKNGEDDITKRTQAMALRDDPDRPEESDHNATRSLPEQQGDGDGDIVQDVLVPWVLQPSRPASTRQPGQPRARKKKRPAAAAEPGNGASAVEREAQATADASVQDEDQASQSPAEEPKVYHRYYHLFLRGELRELVVAAAKTDGYEVLPDPGDGATGDELSRTGPGSEDGKWLRVLGEGWEADNWWIECEVGKGRL